MGEVRKHSSKWFNVIMHQNNVAIKQSAFHCRYLCSSEGVFIVIKIYDGMFRMHFATKWKVNLSKYTTWFHSTIDQAQETETWPKDVMQPHICHKDVTMNICSFLWIDVYSLHQKCQFCIHYETPACDCSTTCVDSVALGYRYLFLYFPSQYVFNIYI